MSCGRQQKDEELLIIMKRYNQACKKFKPYRFGDVVTGNTPYNVNKLLLSFQNETRNLLGQPLNENVLYNMIAKKCKA